MDAEVARGSGSFGLDQQGGNVHDGVVEVRDLRHHLAIASAVELVAAGIDQQPGPLTLSSVDQRPEIAQMFWVSQHIGHFGLPNARIQPVELLLISGSGQDSIPYAKRRQRTENR